MARALRDACRSLLRDRLYALLAIVLLALTGGAITAIFAIVHAVILAPFTFADQDRLAIIWQTDLRRALPVIEVAYREAEDWQRRSRSFDDVAVVGSVNWSLALAEPGASGSLSLSAVSANFFRVLGRPPLLGRGFEPGDDLGMLPTVAIISHGVWVRRYGADPGIVGRVLPWKSDAAAPPVPLEVIGVMPPAFDFPRGAEVWLPAAPLMRRDGQAWNGDPEGALAWLRVFYAVGRLRPGVHVGGATQELTQVIRTTDTKGGPEPPTGAVVTPVAEYLLGPARPVLWTLLAGAALMLAIACANVAGLQVSRAARRQRALAVQIALGASHLLLVRQTLAESAVITGAALGGAVLVALAAARVLVALAPQGVPRLDTVALLDPRVLAFGAAAGFITVILSGLWPALVASRLDAVRVLAHGPGVAADPGGRRLQRMLVVSQVAIALTLLAGTGLFVRTVRGLDRTALGFDAAGVLSVNVIPETSDIGRWQAFYEALEARIRAVPGVTAVGAVSNRPLSGPIGWDNQPIYPGQVPTDPATWGLNPHTNLMTVTPQYFEAMGIRLVRGRLFSPSDTFSAQGVVIVSESATRRLWPGRDPLGQRLHDISHRSTEAEAHKHTDWQTVVGVVEDVRYRGLTDVRLDLYVPAAQSMHRVQHLMIKTAGNPADLTAAVRQAARALDPAAEAAEAVPMAAVVAAESAPWRFMVRVFVLFAATAAVLAAIGLGAVITLAVLTRRRELAIRAALGADAARLRAFVLREGLWLTTAGSVLGLLGAVALGRAVAGVLVGVTPHDVLALGAAAVLATAVGLFASWLPARRAAEANPADALRAE